MLQEDERARLAVASWQPTRRQGRGEIEGRCWNAGLGHRCRFLGDVPSHRFDDLMVGCDSVCIPARTWQDEGLAQKALAYGTVTASYTIADFSLQGLTSCNRDTINLRLELLRELTQF